MARSIYALWTDELGHSLTPVLTTGTADANFPITNIKDGDPASIFLTSSSSTAVDVDWDLGSAIEPKMFSLHHHNIPAGTNVRIQRGATQGATTSDVALTIATFPNTGLPLPPWVDLTGTGAYQWVRLHIPSLAQKVGFGEALIWSAKRQDVRNLQFPFRSPESHPQRIFETGYGHKRRVRRGVRLRSKDGTILTTSADYATFLTWFRTWANATDPFLWILDPAVNDAWLADFGADTIIPEFSAFNNTPVPVVIEERACGFAIPTS